MRKIFLVALIALSTIPARADAGNCYIAKENGSWVMWMNLTNGGWQNYTGDLEKLTGIALQLQQLGICKF